LSVGYSDQDIFNNEDLTVEKNGVRIVKQEIEFSRKLIRAFDKDLKDVENIVFNIKKHKDIEWDWKLTEKSRKTNMKKVFKWLAIKGIRHPSRNIKRLKILIAERVYKGLRSSKILKDKEVVNSIMDIGILVQNMTKGSEFERYDILVRKDLSDLFFSGVGPNAILESEQRKIYEEMQFHRTGSRRHGIERFLRLLQSVERFGLSSFQFPLHLTSCYRIYDGAHRLAIYLTLGKGGVHIRSNPLVRNTNYYGREWFVDRFNKETVDALDGKALDLLIHTGAAFNCLIWEPALEFLDEIVDELEAHGAVIKVDRKIELISIRKFCVEMYAYDGIERWKVERKVQFLEKYGNSIGVVYLSLDEQKYRRKYSDLSILSDSMAKIKGIVRNKFKSRIEGYFGDLIIHSSDNPHMSRNVNKVINCNKK
jgi:hypothetical protein